MIDIAKSETFKNFTILNKALLFVKLNPELDIVVYKKHGSPAPPPHLPTPTIITTSSSSPDG